MKAMINFDNAATTFPKPVSVRKAAAEAISIFGGNAGRGGHELAMRTSEALYSARETAAGFFGAEPENTVFTLNCTHALNMAIQGVMAEGGHLIISSMEHNSAARPAVSLAVKKQITLSVAEVFPDADRTAESFRRLIRSDTKAIVCTLASNVTGQLLLAAGNFHKLAFPVNHLEFNLHRLHTVHITVRHMDFLYGRLVDAGIVPECLNCFLLTVISLEHLRPLRPRIIFAALFRRTGHHLQLGHGCSSQADARTGTVIAGVTAAHNNHMLSFRVEERAVLQAGNKQTLGNRFQEIHREENSLRIAAGNRKRTGLLCSAAQGNGIVCRKNVLRIHGTANVGIILKADAFSFHQPHAPFYHGFVEFHVGNAVHQQPAGAVIPLIHRHGMSPPVKHVRHSKSGRPGTDDRNLLSRAHGRNPRFDKAFCKSFLDDKKFIVVHRHRLE